MKLTGSFKLFKKKIILDLKFKNLNQILFCAIEQSS